MNKFNKGKKIGILTAALASVALAGVGFSTWVIGTQNKETDGSLKIEADTVEYKYLSIDASFTGDLYLAGTTSDNDIKKDFHFSGTKECNRTISASFTITAGKDYVNDFDFTYIKLSIETATQDGNYVDNTVGPDGVKISRTNSTGLTYISDPENIALGNKNFTGDGNTKKWTIQASDITFGWGTLFNSESPITYYNNGCASLTGEQKATYLDNAYQELDAMHTKYGTDAKMKVKVELIKEGE